MMSASPSSSSTRSTSIALGSTTPAGPSVIVLLPRQREAEPRALRAGVQPDAAAEVLDDLPAQGEPHARARVGAALVEALEEHEDAVGVLRVDAHAVVGDREQPLRAVAVGCHHDTGRRGVELAWA